MVSPTIMVFLFETRRIFHGGRYYCDNGVLGYVIILNMKGVLPLW